MLFKRRFTTLKDIENFLIYTPPIFIIIFTFIAIIVTSVILDNKQRSRIDLITQEDKFLKNDLLLSYVNDINNSSHAMFDKVEDNLIKSIYEIRGYAHSENQSNFDIKKLVKTMNSIEKTHEINFVVFDILTFKLLYGDDIITHLRTLTNSNIQTEKFQAHILKNIFYIGKENLQYWIDNKKRKIQLSYFEKIDNSSLYIGAFSKVDDIKYITKDTILNTIPIKNKAINGYFWFYDYANGYVYNYNNQSFKTAISDLKKNNKIIQSYKYNRKPKDEFYETYDFSKYQYLVAINEAENLSSKIDAIKEEYRQKSINIYSIIFLIAISLITMLILFSKFITRIFAKYNRRLSLRNRLFKEWKDRYELAIIASNDGFWDIDFETNKIYFSKQWLKMFGYKKDDITTFDDWFELIHDEDKKNVRYNLDLHIKDQISNFICEYRLKCKNNTYVWVLARGKVFKNNDYTPKRMIMMSMNIDERKNLSKELEDVELLVNVGRIVIFKWQNSKTLKIDYVSNSITSYGYAFGEIHDFMTIVYEDDRQLLKDTIAGALLHNLNSFSLTYRVYEKNGEIKWVFNRSIIIKDHMGKVTHFYGYVNDITQMKLNEQELEQKVSDEVEKNVEKDRLLAHQSKLASMGEMIGNIAHQWRQPLNNINLLIHYVRDNIKNFKEDELKETIAQAKLQIDFMSQTIDDFRNFYQPNKDKVKFDIKTSIIEASKVLTTPFEKLGINLEINAENIEIYNYKNEFQQVIINILNNAYDAALLKINEKGFKPKVSIDINVKNNNVYIYLKNNCGNATEEVIDRMFEPYFTTKFENRGTGVGLYMSKTIIEKNMNGSICTINEDDGVKFTIVLSLSSYNN